MLEHVERGVLYPTVVRVCYWFCADLVTSHQARLITLAEERVP